MAPPKIRRHVPPPPPPRPIETRPPNNALNNPARVRSPRLTPKSNGAVLDKQNSLQLSGANQRAKLNQQFDQGLSILGNTAKGADVDRTLPRRYSLEPPRGDTVTGIRDNNAGKVRGTPPRPVGEAIIRFDRPDNRTKYPHINFNPKLTGVPDPHTRISPTTLRALGGAARTLETFGRVARPLAVVTDVTRLGLAINSDGNQFGRNSQITTGSIAGGWAGAVAGGLAGAKGGALAGAAIGAFFGGVGAAPGAAIGGFIGGLVGSIAGAHVGSSVGEQAATAIIDR